ncbi:hypothetical protein FPV67DRAFT_642024 [Lyophyllum atratum]|nr:hypothetical protein FPV67DRAFT_642024 [Lyophyllum atratum]
MTCQYRVCNALCAIGSIHNSRHAETYPMFAPYHPLSRCRPRRGQLYSPTTRGHAPTETVSTICLFLSHSLPTSSSRVYPQLAFVDPCSSIPSTINVASYISGIATDPFDTRRIACVGKSISPSGTHASCSCPFSR